MREPNLRGLAGLDPGPLYELLRTESRPTVALILGCLAPVKAAAVLSEFPQDARDQIVERLALLGPTRIEVVETVAELLCARRPVARTTGWTPGVGQVRVEDEPEVYCEVA